MFLSLLIVLTSISRIPDVSSDSSLIAGIDYVQGQVVLTFAPSYAPNATAFSPAPPGVGTSSIDSLLQYYEGFELRKLVSTFDTYTSEAGQRLERTYLFRYEADIDAQDLADQFLQLPYFERVELNLILHLEPAGTRRFVPGDTTLFADQWYFDNSDSGDSSDIDLPEAWAIEPGGNPELVIGIFDTGTMIDTTTNNGGWRLHSDFNFHWVAAEDSASPGIVNGADLDGVDNNGDREGSSNPFVFSANIIGFNLLEGYDADTTAGAEYRKRFWYGVPHSWRIDTGPNNDCGCPPRDPGCPCPDSWVLKPWDPHGVWVGSIAAAKLDGWKQPGPHQDIVGVAYRCQIYNGRFSGTQGSFDMAQAIIHLAKKARVVNMSFGGRRLSTNVRDATRTAARDHDCVLVGSTGNNDTTVWYPAKYDSVLAVGATKRSPMSLASYSNYDLSARYVDVVAPVGESPPVADSYSQCLNNYPCSPNEVAGPITEVGTSFAAPQVSGLAALIRSRFPAMNQADVKARIENSAQFYWADTETNRRKYGSGKINAYRALTEWGSVTGNVEWSATDTRDGIFYVSGDLNIEDGAVLTINEGVVVRVAPDHEEGGANENKVEIVVENGGQLDIQGTSGEPVQFESFTDSAPSDTDWVGIRFEGGSSGSVEHVVIRNAEVAIDNSSNGVAIDHAMIEDCEAGVTTDADLSLSHTTITDCATWGLSAAYADSAYIGHTTIQNCNDSGIMIFGGTALKISNSTVSGCDVGIDAYSGARLYADTTDFIGNDLYGIWLEPGSSWQTPMSTINGCTFKHNALGMYITGTAPAAIQITKCLVDSNTAVGICGTNGANLALVDNTIQHNETGVIGAGSACDVDLRRGNWVMNNDEGLKFQGTLSAAVESTEVAYNDIGIIAQTNANPDVGHESGGVSVGYNMIHHNYPHHIENLSTGVTVMAEMNWWRGEEPSSNRFVGSVDYDPWLEGDAPEIHSLNGPGNVSPYVPLEGEVPTQYSLSFNYPNPFNPVTTIVYEVPPPGARVEIMIYSVAGERVTSLVSEHKRSGVYKVIWDGTSTRGEAVATGVYFVRMTAGNFTETRKIMLLK
jgi:hypothetical protein